MLLEIHCFINKVNIEPLPNDFQFGDYSVSLRRVKFSNIDGLELKIRKSTEIKEFMPEEGEDRDKFSEKILAKYRLELLNVVLYLEGLLSLYFPREPLDFDISNIMINALPEGEEEKTIFDNDGVVRGVGDVHVINPPGHLYPWSDKLQNMLEGSSTYLPFLSFFSEAIKANRNHKQEIAFFLLFKIIEGRYGDGTQRVEAALKSKSSEIEKYLPNHPDLRKHVKNILEEKLKLSSKCESGNIDDLISDLVLIRHKILHFDEDHQEHHFNTGMKLELTVINYYLAYACIRIIRKDLLGE